MLASVFFVLLGRYVLLIVAFVRVARGRLSTLTPTHLTFAAIFLVDLIELFGCALLESPRRISL